MRKIREREKEREREEVIHIYIYNDTLHTHHAHVLTRNTI